MGFTNDPVVNSDDNEENQNGDIVHHENFANGHHHQDEIAHIDEESMEQELLLEFDDGDSVYDSDEDIVIEFSDEGSDDLDPLDECIG